MCGNQLCGVRDLNYGYNTYNAWGIERLCQELKGSAVTSLMCAPPYSIRFVSGPVDTAVFTASRLCNNLIGGYFDNQSMFVATDEGVNALCELLEGSAITSLECAAAPYSVCSRVSVR